MGRPARSSKAASKTPSQLLVELSEDHTKNANNVPLLVTRIGAKDAQVWAVEWATCLSVCGTLPGMQ